MNENLINHRGKNKEKWGMKEKGGMKNLIYFTFSPSLHLLLFSLIFFVFFLCVSVPQW